VAVRILEVRRFQSRCREQIAGVIAEPAERVQERTKVPDRLRGRRTRFPGAGAKCQFFDARRHGFRRPPAADSGTANDSPKEADMRSSLIANLVLISSSVLALAAPWAQADKAPHLDPAITRVADAYVAAVLKGDPAAVAPFFREDGVLMPDCAPRAAGRAAVEDSYRHMFGGPGRLVRFTLDHAESRIEGGLAFDAGTSRQTISRGPNVPPLELAGKYLVVLKQTGGEWKIAYLIYNGDQPMPGAP
jgi:uncharacterized protein (TIGR02246 family)